MSKENLEHLSSLMDGELSRETGLFLTRRLSSDKTLSETWERYHLIRDCIRQPGGGVPHVKLTSRMRVALEAEPVEQGSGSVNGRWLRPLTGVAIAASVALMAIVAVGPSQQLAAPGDEAGQPFTSPNAISTLPMTQAASFSGTANARDTRLNSYLLRHNQLSGASSKGFVSFVPIISVEQQEQLVQPDQADKPEESEDKQNRR